ncbi:MAG: hypothetical protein WCG98_09775 [bacterium]
MLRLADGLKDIEYLLSLANDGTSAEVEPHYPDPYEDHGKPKAEKDHSLSKQESKFLAFYNEHNDNADVRMVAEGLAYGMTIQELANASKIDVDSPDELISKLFDLNFDGKNDFGDK